MDPFLIKEDIRKLRPEVDYIMVAIHWATSRSAEVSPLNRAFAHELIDAGADVILGHHPPHPKGIEVYHGKVVLYAPSNVLRGHNGPALDDGYLARFTRTQGGRKNRGVADHRQGSARRTHRTL
jgi:poly-gamma-glutamate capsule biosynthesis protein CapA/YwtB (metallophosphatase superfamily)